MLAKGKYKVKVQVQSTSTSTSTSTNTSTKSKTDENTTDAISSIEYVVHEKTLEIFNSRKVFFEEKKRGLNKVGKVKELLLFHGTDASKIDSILENNFSIDAVPNDRKKKMAYGRGVYMSEHPQMALAYGDTLLLCRVSSFIPSHYPKDTKDIVCRFFLERLRDWTGLDMGWSRTSRRGTTAGSWCGTTWGGSMSSKMRLRFSPTAFSISKMVD